MSLMMTEIMYPHGKDELAERKAAVARVHPHLAMY
jgi:hypothetical protein